MKLSVDIVGFEHKIPIHLFGRDLFILREVLILALVLLAVLIIAIIIGRAADKQDARKQPTKLLVAAEWLWNFSGSDVETLSDDDPKQWKTMLHVYATNIFLMVFLSNTISLWGLHSPAANIIIAASLGLLVGILVHGLGLLGGVGSYFKSYTKPFIIFLPINIISAVSEIISISMRLFGNSLASMILATLIKQAMMMIPFIGAVSYPIAGSALMLYDIFIAYIQSLLFMRLSMTYIREKVLIHVEAAEERAEKEKEQKKVKA